MRSSSVDVTSCMRSDSSPEVLCQQVWRSTWTQKYVDTSFFVQLLCFFALGEGGGTWTQKYVDNSFFVVLFVSLGFGLLVLPAFGSW